MRKWQKAVVTTIVTLAAVLFVLPVTAEAKNPSMVRLKTGKTYKSYDITGDKKKDTIKITTPKNKYETYDVVKIKINNQTTKLKNTWGSFSIKTYLVTLKNGRSYLWIKGEAENEDDPWECLYRYKNGKLVKAVDFKNSSYNYTNHHNTRIIKVAGNTISTRQYIMSTAMAGVDYKVDYAYKNGTLKRTSSAYTIVDAGYKYMTNSKPGTMKSTKALYRDASCMKKAGTVKAGTKANAVKIYMTKKAFHVKIKTVNGKTGWVKGSRRFNSNALIFKECFYAG